MTPFFALVGRAVSRMTWDDLFADARARLALVVLDTLGCALAGRRVGPHRGLVDAVAALGGPGDATLWFERQRLPAPHAALLNGTIAHHIEMDDGHPLASLHGGVTILPAAIAAAELTGCSGRRLLTAVAAGYSAAVACGRPMLDSIVAHRLHPPGIVGCFGAAAASAHALGLSDEQTTGALSLAGSLLPVAPFEPFTKGAPVKDLYGGWPAYVGVLAALMARDGVFGPADAFEAPDDGVAHGVLHGPPADCIGPDPNEILNTHFKAYATCRSVQPTLTALERTLPLEPSRIESIVVETYPFAVELSEDADAATAIGAKASIPYCVAALLEQGHLGPESFGTMALADESRRRLADRVTVGIAEEMVAPVVRGARVSVRFVDGTERRNEVTATKWSKDDPATNQEIRRKFRELAGSGAERIEAWVDGLDGARTVSCGELE